MFRSVCFYSFSEHGARPVFNKFHTEVHTEHPHRRDTFQRSVPVRPVPQQKAGEQPIGSAATAGEQLDYFTLNRHLSVFLQDLNSQAKIITILKQKDAKPQQFSRLFLIS